MYSTLILTSLLFSTTLLANAPIERENCFSCNIQINSLDNPIDLSGNWLFTRNDEVKNVKNDLNLDDWVLVGTPGPWSKAYNDGKNFPVGWYRGNLTFNKDLIGKKATLYLDAYMSKIDVFLDGKRIYARRGKQTHRDYRSIQPIPINFRIKKSNHTLTFRINTRLMTGVYQSPFQLRPYKEFDPFINFMEIFCGELRYIFAYTFFWTGLFFLAIFAKTKYPLYLVSALTGIGIFPFYAMPNNILIKWFEPDMLLVLHYPGLGFMSLGYFLFSQFFYKFNKKLTILYSIIVAAYSLVFLILTFSFNLDIFQIARKSLFIVSFSIATHGVVNCVKGLAEDRRILILIIGQIIFWVCAGHDIALALGLIKSTGLIFQGTFCGIFSIMLVTVKLFGETFIENKNLLKKVEANNYQLEATVAERTQSLREQSIEMKTILQSLPEAVVKADDNLKVLTSFSLVAEDILKTKEIDGQDLVDLIFRSSNLSKDHISRIRSSLEMSVGEPRWTFEVNQGSLPSEISRKLEDNIQHLALGWNVICDEDDEVFRILLTVSDITALRKSSHDSTIWQLKSIVLNSVLDGHSQKLQRLVDAGNSAIKLLRDPNNEWTDDVKHNYLRTLHTIKGNARALGLRQLSEHVHEAETLIQGLKGSSKEDQFIEINEILDEINEYFETVSQLIITVSSKLEQRGQHGSYSSSKLKEIENFITSNPTEALNMVKQLRFVSPVSLTNEIPKLYQEIATNLGKSNILFNIKIASDLKIDPEFNAELEDVLGHLIRNSLDHGIEFEDDRIKTGKDKNGCIRIQLHQTYENLVLTYEDDGRGLDLNLLKAKGMSKGLCEKTLGFRDIKNLVLKPNFSTSESVSDISGRGIGMNIFIHFVEKWSGAFHWVEPKNKDSDIHPFSIVVYFPIELSARDGSLAELQASS